MNNASWMSGIFSLHGKAGLDVWIQIHSLKILIKNKWFPGYFVFSVVQYNVKLSADSFSLELTVILSVI